MKANWRRTGGAHDCTHQRWSTYPRRSWMTHGKLTFNLQVLPGEEERSSRWTARLNWNEFSEMPHCNGQTADYTKIIQRERVAASLQVSAAELLQRCKKRKQPKFGWRHRRSFLIIIFLWCWEHWKPINMSLRCHLAGKDKHWQALKTKGRRRLIIHLVACELRIRWARIVSHTGCSDRHIARKRAAQKVMKSLNVCVRCCECENIECVSLNRPVATSQRRWFAVWTALLALG